MKNKFKSIKRKTRRSVRKSASLVGFNRLMALVLIVAMLASLGMTTVYAEDEPVSTVEKTDDVLQEGETEASESPSAEPSPSPSEEIVPNDTGDGSEDGSVMDTLADVVHIIVEFFTDLFDGSSDETCDIAESVLSADDTTEDLTVWFNEDETMGVSFDAAAVSLLKANASDSMNLTMKAVDIGEGAYPTGTAAVYELSLRDGDDEDANDIAFSDGGGSGCATVYIPDDGDYTVWYLSSDDGTWYAHDNELADSDGKPCFETDFFSAFAIVQPVSDEEDEDSGETPDEPSGEGTEETPEPTDEGGDSEHHYEGQVITSATCTEAGEIVYTCTDEGCGHSYTETIPAMGHDYVETARTDATCTEAGSITYTCSRCEDTYTEHTEVDPDNHDYVELVTKEATCTEAGEKTFTCSRCGKSYTEEIPALGHQYENGFCTRCQAEELVESIISYTTEDGGHVEITGALPVGATVTAIPVTGDIPEGTFDDGTQVVAALDITIYRQDGTIFEPVTPVSVNIYLPELINVGDASVYHMENETAVPELVAESLAPETNQVEFNAESFSIYVVTTSDLDSVQGRFLAAGNTWSGTVTSSFTAFSDTYTVYYDSKTTSNNILYFYCQPWAPYIDSKGGSPQGSTGFTWSITPYTQSTTENAYIKLATQTVSGSVGSCVSVTLKQAVTSDTTIKISCTYTNDYSGSSNDYTVTDSFYLLIKPNPGIQIVNNISSNGCIAANPTNTSTYTYVWSKWTSSQNPNSDTPSTVTDDNVLQDNGKSLNVAKDQGGLCYYQVQATDTSTHQIYTSPVFQVPYATALQNGGFESPVLKNNHDQLPNGYPGLYWKTTGPGEDEGSTSHVGCDIEIIRTATSANQTAASSAYGTSKANGGSQFAELNCEASGALYQDVLTAPGATLYWSLYHKARGASSASRNDTMYVVIMASSQAASITTQAQVLAVINNPSSYPGATVTKLTDNSVSWTYHNGSYSVPSSQYLTRFFFVAGNTASGDDTVGNLLDDVNFSCDVPYTIEYYVKNTSGTYVLQEGFTETGTVSPYTTVSASNTSQFSSYALEKTELNGSDHNGSTSMMVDPAKANILKIYYVTNGVTVYKEVTGLQTSELPANYTAIFKLYTLSGSSLGTLKGTATVTVTDGFTGSVIFKDTNGNPISLSSGTKYAIVETSTTSVTGFEQTVLTGSGTVISSTTNGYIQTFTATSGGNSVYFINSYTKGADSTSIKVQKVFSGLTPEEIPANFAITVKNSSGTTVATLNSNVDHTTTVDSTVPSVTWTWTVSGLSTGNYTISETGADVDSYTLTVTGTGSVTTAASTIAFTTPTVVNTGSSTQFTIGQVNLIVAKLTSSDGYFVWTTDTLTANDRPKVLALINSVGGFSPTATDANTYFYSGNNLTQAAGLYFRGAYIRYDGTNTLYFAASNQWTKFFTSTYSFAGGETPEITVTNTYYTNIELPETGGSGTRMFTIIGGIIMLAALATLIAYFAAGKRRREGKKKKTD